MFRDFCARPLRAYRRRRTMRVTSVLSFRSRRRREHSFLVVSARNASEVRNAGAGGGSDYRESIVSVRHVVVRRLGRTMAERGRERKAAGKEDGGGRGSRAHAESWLRAFFSSAYRGPAFVGGGRAPLVSFVSCTTDPAALCRSKCNTSNDARSRSATRSIILACALVCPFVCYLARCHSRAASLFYIF